MTDIRVEVIDPQVSPRQRPLARTVLETRISTSLPWTEVETFQAAESPKVLVLNDVPPGVHYFRAIAFDIDDKPGAPGLGQANVAFDVPGEPTVNVTVQ